MFLVDKVDKLYVFQRTANWFFPRIEGNFPQWYKDLLRMFPFLMTLNFWAMFALIEVQSLLWMRKGWTERYNVIFNININNYSDFVCKTFSYFCLG